jgi:hypothetical protein
MSKAQELHQIAHERTIKDGLSICSDILTELEILANNGHFQSVKTYDINQIKADCLREMGFELELVQVKNGGNEYIIKW